MIKIAVASRNPVKMDAVKEGLSVFLNNDIELHGVLVQSGVPDQPMGNAETLKGAEIRVENAQFQYPGYDFYVGVDNLLNYKQKNPIINAEDPFVKGFDDSLIWGPLMGRVIYAGVRIRLGKQY